MEKKTPDSAIQALASAQTEDDVTGFVGPIVVMVALAIGFVHGCNVGRNLNTATTR